MTRTLIVSSVANQSSSQPQVSRCEVVAEVSISFPSTISCAISCSLNDKPVATVISEAWWTRTRLEGLQNDCSFNHYLVVTLIIC